MLTAGVAEAQSVKSRFAVCDSLALTTAAADSTFTYPWESLTIWTVGCDAYYKIEINRQDELDDDPWFRIDEGSFITITKNQALGISGVYRLRVKTVTGTGAMFLFGTKTTDG